MLFSLHMASLTDMQTKPEDREMELIKGRPETDDGRPDKEIRVYNLLDSLGIDYWRIDHEAAYTMEACEEIFSCGR